MTGEHHCSNIEPELQAFVLDTLAPARQRVVANHLETCAACQQELARVRARMERLNAFFMDTPAPDDLVEQTLRQTRMAAPQSTWMQTLVPAAAMVATVVVMAALLVPTLSRPREAAKRASTQNNMKQLGLAFKMYANESDGERWPALVADDNAWAPDLERLFQDYINDPGVLVSAEGDDRERIEVAMREALNPESPDFHAAEALFSESFAYLGHHVKSVEDLEALKRSRAGLYTESEEGSEIFPLREGIERFLITDINNPASASDAQSEIPVLIEVAGWREKRSMDSFKGANVLYMDGHVKFVELGTFPVVPEVMELLAGK